MYLLLCDFEGVTNALADFSPRAHLIVSVDMMDRNILYEVYKMQPKQEHIIKMST